MRHLHQYIACLLCRCGFIIVLFFGAVRFRGHNYSPVTYSLLACYLFGFIYVLPRIHQRVMVRYSAQRWFDEPTRTDAPRPMAWWPTVYWNVFLAAQVALAVALCYRRTVDLYWALAILLSTSTALWVIYHFMPRWPGIYVASATVELAERTIVYPAGGTTL